MADGAGDIPQTQMSPAVDPPVPAAPKIPRLLYLLVIAFVIVIGGTGVFLYSQQSTPGIVPTPTIMPISPLPVEATIPPVALQDAIPLSAAHNSFGFDILHQLQKEEKNSNIFLSPSSIFLALAMTYTGADGPTKEEMSRALHIQGIDAGTMHSANAALIALLQNPDPQVQVAIANSIWTRTGERFSADFLKTNQTYYGAKLSSLDFSLPSSADTINAWASDATRGKIPTIVVPPIPSDLVMYLINAIYFKGSWTTEFDPKLTENRVFTTAAGAKKEIPMMQQTGSFSYAENERFQAVQIPYGKNQRLGMYVFLPKAGLDTFAEDLRGETWTEWLGTFNLKQGTVVFPKYKIEYKTSLNAPLMALGMKTAFGGGADFSKMREDPSQKDLFISEVIHKTYVDVNEQGTEAAAVTEVGMSRTSVIDGQNKPFYLEVNRPFFFAIVDTQTTEMLFMGTVTDPVEAS